MSGPSGIWTTTGPLTQDQYAAIRPVLEGAAELGWTLVKDGPREWRWQPFMAQVDSDELPDKDINPDEAEPLPPDEPVKTDPIPEEPQ